MIIHFRTICTTCSIGVIQVAVGQAPFAFTYEDPASTLPVGVPHVIAEPDGDLLISAALPFTLDFQDTTRVQFLRVDPSGVLLDNWTLLGSGVNLNHLQPLPLSDGGCVAMGRANFEPLFLRCAPDGTPTVARSYSALGLSFPVPWSLAYLPDSTIFAVSLGTVARLTLLGDVIWWKQVTISGASAGFVDIVHASASEIILLGITGGAFPDFHSTLTSIDTAGTINWSQAIVQENEPGDVICYGGSRLPNGDLRLGGKYYASGGDFEPIVLAFDDTGGFQWGRRWLVPPGDTIGYDMHDVHGLADGTLYLSDGGNHGSVIAVDGNGDLQASGVMPKGLLRTTSVPGHGYYAMSQAIGSGGVPVTLLMHPDNMLHLCSGLDQEFDTVSFVTTQYPGWTESSPTLVVEDFLPVLSVVYPPLQTSVFCEDISTAVPAMERSTIGLFPNPASDEVFVRLPGSMRSSRLWLMDLSGRIVHGPAQVSDGERLDLRGLASGIYTVVLEAAAMPIRLVLE
jgi:hypothetical protein